MSAFNDAANTNAEEPVFYEGEYPLEDEYPVRKTFWYVIGDKPWKSDRNCTVSELTQAILKSKTAKGESISIIPTITSCNFEARGLAESPNLFPFEIVREI